MLKKSLVWDLTHLARRIRFSGESDSFWCVESRKRGSSVTTLAHLEAFSRGGTDEVFCSVLMDG